LATHRSLATGFLSGVRLRNQQEKSRTIICAAFCDGGLTKKSLS
jgi:hypothetical protein